MWRTEVRYQQAQARAIAMLKQGGMGVKVGRWDGGKAMLVYEKAMEVRGGWLARVGKWQSARLHFRLARVPHLVWDEVYDIRGSEDWWPS